MSDVDEAVPGAWIEVKLADSQTRRGRLLKCYTRGNRRVSAVLVPSGEGGAPVTVEVPVGRCQTSPKKTADVISLNTDDEWEEALTQFNSEHEEVMTDTNPSDIEPDLRKLVAMMEKLNLRIDRIEKAPAGTASSDPPGTLSSVSGKTLTKASAGKKAMPSAGLDGLTAWYEQDDVGEDDPGDEDDEDEDWTGEALMLRMTGGASKPGKKKVHFGGPVPAMPGEPGSASGASSSSHLVAAKPATIQLPSSDPSTALLQELVQQTAATSAILRDLKRKEADGDDLGEARDPAVGAGRKFNSVRRLRRRIEEQPEEVVSEWILHVRETLGVMPRQPWKLSDYSFKIRTDFPTNVGLWRAHYLVSEALSWAVVRNQPWVCFASLVQVLKGLHQAALNQGRWRIASLLQLPVDPLSPPEFGGMPAELAGVASYDSALTTLNSSVGGRRAQQAPGAYPFGTQGFTGSSSDGGQPAKGGQKGYGRGQSAWGKGTGFQPWQPQRTQWPSQPQWQPRPWGPNQSQQPAGGQQQGQQQQSGQQSGGRGKKEDER